MSSNFKQRIDGIDYPLDEIYAKWSSRINEQYRFYAPDYGISEEGVDDAYITGGASDETSKEYGWGKVPSEEEACFKYKNGNNTIQIPFSKVTDCPIPIIAGSEDLTYPFKVINAWSEENGTDRDINLIFSLDNVGRSQYATSTDPDATQTLIYDESRTYSPDGFFLMLQAAGGNGGHANSMSAPLNDMFSKTPKYYCAQGGGGGGGGAFAIFYVNLSELKGNKLLVKMQKSDSSRGVCIQLYLTDDEGSSWESKAEAILYGGAHGGDCDEISSTSVVVNISVDEEIKESANLLSSSNGKGGQQGQVSINYEGQISGLENLTYRRGLNGGQGSAEAFGRIADTTYKIHGVEFRDIAKILKFGNREAKARSQQVVSGEYLEIYDSDQYSQNLIAHTNNITVEDEPIKIIRGTDSTPYPDSWTTDTYKDSLDRSYRFISGGIGGGSALSRYSSATGSELPVKDDAGNSILGFGGGGEGAYYKYAPHLNTTSYNPYDYNSGRKGQPALVAILDVVNPNTL